MNNKKKIIVISTVLVVFLIIILFVIMFALKPKNSTSQTINNNSNQEQLDKISLKVKADVKTLKFNVSMKNIENTEFNIEKSYSKEFDNPMELKNSKNNLQSEDDLTQDIEDNVEKCYYRVKVQNLETDEIKYSNVITIKLKKLLSDSGDEDNVNDAENNTKENEISEWNIDDEESYIIDIDSPDENEFQQINYADDDNYETYNEEIIEEIFDEEIANEINYNVEYIYLSEKDIKFDLSGYKETTLVASIGPSTARDKSVKWTSSNTQIAVVDQNGKVTAKSNGTAKIIAQTSNGKSDECEINVTTSPTNITLNKTSINLDILNNRQENLLPNIIPSTSSDKTLIWTSSNENIATVDSSGLVSANSNGTATIKCETPNGKSSTCEVNVTTSGSGVYLNKANATLDLIETEQLNLKATIVPSSAVYNKVTWSSSNPNVAKVIGSGLTATITAVQPGTSTITVNIDGKKSVCNVTVKKGKLVVTKTNNNVLEIDGNNKTKININNQKNVKNVKYITSNANIAVVDNNGIITGKKVGTTRIVVETDRGIGECEVDVWYKTGIRAEKYQGLNYYLFVPEYKYIDINKLSMILYFHGAGCNFTGDPNDFIGLATILKNINGKYKSRKADFKSIVIFPYHPSDEAGDVGIIDRLVGILKNKYNVNSKKVNICGHSMGARVAWKIAARVNKYTYKNLQFASIVSIGTPQYKDYQYLRTAIKDVRTNGVNTVPVYFIASLNWMDTWYALRNIVAVSRPNKDEIALYDGKSENNYAFTSRVKIFPNSNHAKERFDAFTEVDSSYNLIKWIQEQERTVIY